MLSESLILLFKDYGFLVAFLAGLFGGESALISLSFFWARGLFNLSDILIFSTLGFVICDFVLFYFGRTRYAQRIIKSKRFSKAYNQVDKFIESKIHGNTFFILFITRFIYLAPPVTILYLGTKRISFRKFLTANIIVTFIWFIPMITIGYLFGKGFTYVYTFFKSLSIALSLLVLVIILFYMFRKWITKKLIQRHNQ